MSITKIPVRELRDILNLAHAAFCVAAVTPYQGGMNGRVQDAYGLLVAEMVNRAGAYGISEQIVWATYRRIERQRPLMIEDLRPLYDTTLTQATLGGHHG